MKRGPDKHGHPVQEAPQALKPWQETSNNGQQLSPIDGWLLRDASLCTVLFWQVKATSYGVYSLMPNFPQHHLGILNQKCGCLGLVPGSESLVLELCCAHIPFIQALSILLLLYCCWESICKVPPTLHKHIHTPVHSWIMAFGGEVSCSSFYHS